MRTSFSKGSRTSIVELTTEKVVVRGEEPVIVLDGKAKKLQLLKGSDVVHQSLDAEDRATVRGNTKGLLWQTKDSAGNWTDRMELTGGVDVAELRTRKTVQKIIPSEAGADALIIRDTNDTEDRLKLTEGGHAFLNGSIVFNKIAWDTTIPQLWQNTKYNCISLGVPGRGDLGVNVFKGGVLGLGTKIQVDTYIGSNPGWGTGIIIYRDYIDINAHDADDVNTLRDSQPLKLTAKYWDGTQSVWRVFQLFHRMLSTTPESELALQLAGVDYLRIGDRGFRIEKNVFDAGSSVSVDAGATYTIPQGVYYVICGANTSVEVYDDVGATWVTLIPAGGVGIVVSDGSNARLYNAGTVAESSTLRRVF